MRGKGSIGEIIVGYGRGGRVELGRWGSLWDGRVGKR